MLKSFINDPVLMGSSEVIKFAYGTSLFRVAIPQGQSEMLQKAHSMLDEWAIECQMRFNVNKFNTHGGKNPNFMYTLMSSELAMMN